VPIGVAALMVPVREHIAPANSALVLTAAIVCVAAAFGRVAAASAAVTAAASFDFFLTRPYLSLAIDSRDDVETAVLLLVIGLTVGTVASHARERGEALADRRNDLARIHRVAELVARGVDPVEVTEAATTEITRLLGLRSCRYMSGPGDPTRPVIHHAGTVGTVPRPMSHLHLQPRGFELPAEGVDLPVLSRNQTVGRFELDPSPGVGVSLEQRIVAVAIADQVGAALATAQGT
jgi:K+-sensing histidine kinase KdpD